MAFTGNHILEDAETDAVTDATLIFPRDIGRPFSPESIKFAIYKREGASYAVVRDAGAAVTKQIGATFNTLKKGLKATGDAAAADVANASGDEGKRTPAVSKGVIKEEAENIIGEGAKLVGKITKAGKTTFSAIADAAERKKVQGEASLDNHVQSIYLNMPNSVVFNESVEWQGQDLGAMGAMTNGASAAEAAEVALLGNAGAILGGAAGAVTSALPGISGIAGTVVGAVAGAGGLQGALESTFNVKANPYKEQTFQGVGFRAFDFTFALRARSYEDVKEIQNIIRAFRSHSKPTFETKGKSGVFGYPKEFRIEYLTLDEEDTYVTNPYLPEIKYCVCTAVNTNFTQQGWRSFEGGAPVDISLQLTFQETEIITSEDVEGNTSVGRFKKGGHNF